MLTSKDWGKNPKPKEPFKSAPAVVNPPRLTGDQARWLIANLPKQPESGIITTKWRNAKLSIMKTLQNIIDSEFEVAG